MRSPSNKTADINAITLNKKIVELKKKILLGEGQKKAYTEEWKEELKINSETIVNLKKDIKDLTSELSNINNPKIKERPKSKYESGVKSGSLLGPKSAESFVHSLDLKVINLKKQMDLVHDKYQKRQKHFNKLVEEYQVLLAYKNQSEDVNTNSSETVEEDANKKLICRLENEIHRTTVQWMEAEHIRKKYRAIKGSLMNDAEKFESSLLELEQAISDQQVEINRLQEINKEALNMRDATKMILQRQEQTANSSNRARDRQALDFRRLVEERKQDLERLERKIFSSGKTGLLHQDSIGSSSADQHTGKTDTEEMHQSKETNEMDIVLRKLMNATGATAANEVLSRYLSQREASSRLNYLRATTEAEKKHLEGQRDLLNSQLEEFKFADIKENEVNQEEVEKIKTDINDEKSKMITYQQEEERTSSVIRTIRDALIELFLKLQEIDEIPYDPTNNNKKKGEKCPEFTYSILSDIPNSELLKLLEEKLKLGLTQSGHIADTDSGVSEDEAFSDNIKLPIDELHVPIPTPSSAATYMVDEKEKPPLYPTCYFNLVTGRTTAAAAPSTSPGQTAQIVVSEDEGEVPSRTYLKRQAQVILDAKSRRKGFRAPATRKK